MPGSRARLDLGRRACMSALGALLALGCQTPDSDPDASLTLVIGPDTIIVAKSWLHTTVTPHRDVDDHGHVNPHLLRALEPLNRPRSDPGEARAMRVLTLDSARYGDVVRALQTACEVGVDTWQIIATDRSVLPLVGCRFDWTTIDGELVDLQRQRGCWNLELAIADGRAEAYASMLPWPSIEPGMPIGRSNWLLSDVPVSTDGHKLADDDTEPLDSVVRVTIPVTWPLEASSFAQLDGWVEDQPERPCSAVYLFAHDHTPWVEVEPALAYLVDRGLRAVFWVR